VPTASIVVPTRERPGYLDVALASIAPQAREAGA
jgi:glycosyltransferase involved in cell wall biosynthesis